MKLLSFLGLAFILFGCTCTPEPNAECRYLVHGEKQSAEIVGQFKLDSMTYSNGNVLHSLLIEVLLNDELNIITIYSTGNPLSGNYELINPAFGESTECEQVLTINNNIVAYTRRTDSTELYVKNSIISRR